MRPFASDQYQNASATSGNQEDKNWSKVDLQKSHREHHSEMQRKKIIFRTIMALNLRFSFAISGQNMFIRFLIISVL